MTIAVTGHRPDKLGNDYNLVSPLVKMLRKAVIRELKEYNASKLVSGMALGIDTLFALIAMELDIPLIAAIPFEGQEKKWPSRSQELFNRILNWHKTEKIVVCQGGYAPWKMQRRNEWMVDNSGMLLAVWDESPGGTGNCVEYARRKTGRVVYINPEHYSRLLINK